ncbi:MAG: hypothetical protein JSU65_14020 [Candidatus Zixiibacteriota bacterium]|nr:MAG: hypothetical protein JSU65_14020 [candidate division Zixibacteria bacterium]
MTPKKNKAGFSIGVSCPGCGGELELQEDFFVLSCAHCGSILRVEMPDKPAAFLIRGRLQKNEIRFNVDRFLREQNQPLTDSSLQIKSIYYPYWKVNAMLVRVRNRMERREIRAASENDTGEYVEKEHSEISATSYTATAAAGPWMEGIPIAVGMRSEFLKMHPYSPDVVQESFDPLPIVRSSEHVLNKTIRKFASFGEMSYDSVGINKSDLLEPQFSLVYFPFHIVESYCGGDYNRLLLDGVTGRVLGHRTEIDIGSEDGSSPASNGSPPRPAVGPDDTDGDIPEEEPLTPESFGTLGVEFHRCTNCNEDLPDQQSLVYVCRNCQEVVYLERPQVPVVGVHHAIAPNRRKDELFPFWSFRLDGGDAGSRQVFAGIYDSDRVVIPAFSIASIEASYRLAQRMSTAAPQLPLEPTEMVDERYRPVEIGPNRAISLARVMIYRKLLSRNQSSKIDDVQFSPVEGSLIFAPFHPQSYFYVDSMLGAVTFEKVYGAAPA